VVPITELEIDPGSARRSEPGDHRVPNRVAPPAIQQCVVHRRFGRAMLEHFEALLAGAIAAPDTPLSRPGDTRGGT
jgi:hypothetical protein